jgi:hypothetical protein
VAKVVLHGAQVRAFIGHHCKKKTFHLSLRGQLFYETRCRHAFAAYLAEPMDAGA